MHNVMLITGASRGIGAETAILAAKAGYDICINYHTNKQAAENILSKVTGCGVNAIVVQGDVSKEKDIENIFKQIDDELGRITALVNNAGILETQMRVESLNFNRLERILNTNVIGSVLCAKEAIKRMSTKHGGNGGAIVNLSSRASVLGSPNEYVDYALSKGAIDTFTIGLAKEIAEEGIRVNAVRPGIIDTEIHACGGVPDRAEKLKDGIPMKRAGTALEVAKSIMWLISNNASFCTGTFIDISGGR
ncbi:SDR family oxidoreductase [Francisellaceae bacterium]|nr:SDR family oxidoreductase [Francisellaceae bacterium]